ncbi:hypothetical protein [Natranaeroarchaeum aerophilus]|uniref:DUF4239 domain-containing protein n=1 Tax=Natranaeroarchaeum aerophilus TaxID=2917711 RepID=A0AAE3K3E7_9EURY|nr:hypothetical protein [Natranaeroarchaeum aerophilus]MCL9812443.1 hypothetical protein [Natranaeroarchaeum aerophilus]
MKEHDPGSLGGSRDEGGLRSRVLLTTDRWLLTACVLGAVFATLVAASLLGLAPLARIVDEQGGVQFLFTAFIGAIITGTSVVVTISQLVLAQELGAVGDQRERMEESMAFREDVERAVDAGVASPEPAVFLAELLEGIESQARTLDDTTPSGTEIDEYVQRLVDRTQGVTGALDDAQFGTFGVIRAALRFDYSLQLYHARRLRAEHWEGLDTSARDALDELIDELTLFGPAREHFKTLYFQWELIELSRAMLYVSIPALVVMGGLIMYVDAAAVPGVTLGVDHLVWLTSAGFAVGIAPFVVFIVYVLRILSIARRTLAMGPFVLRETDRETT